MFSKISNQIVICCYTTLLFFISCHFISATAIEITTDPMLSALALEDPVSFCGEPVPMHDHQVKERFEKEMLICLDNRAQVILWLKRSTRYFPFIEEALSKNKLPEDIKYLAVAESALRVHVGSPKGAMGMWQLMPQTAKKYGLLVNDDFDERRNPYLSTTAALRYLTDLKRQFESWSLALAAYNMGEEGLHAQILEQGTDDYYRLYLPLETQRFVLRILSVQKIFQAPEKYGFSLSQDDFYAPVQFSTVSINAFEQIPLRLIAGAARTDFTVIKYLNPEIRGYYLATGIRKVNIPAEGEKGFSYRLQEGIEADAKIRKQSIYTVNPGDSLSVIAAKFDVPLAALLIWNRLGVDSVIHPGQPLVIYPGTPQKEQVPERKRGEADK